MKRFLSSGWEHRCYLLHLPSFFKGTKIWGQGRCDGNVCLQPYSQPVFMPLSLYLLESLNTRVIQDTTLSAKCSQGTHQMDSLYNGLHSHGNLGIQTIMTQVHWPSWLKFTEGLLDQASANFSVKGQTVNILRLMGQKEKSNILHRY